MTEWNQEKEEVKKLKLKSNLWKCQLTNKDELEKLGKFFIKTLDRIADPKFQNEPIPEQLFEIGPIMS